MLRRIPPETAHALAARGVRSRTGSACCGCSGRPDPVLAVDALGLRFASPLGVAAGVDKDASWFEGLGALGFGSVEVGTVTPRRRRATRARAYGRLTADRALQNSMGFPNPGAEAVAARLAQPPRPTVVGVNVGRAKGSRDRAGRRGLPRDRAPARAHADYLVLNVSSPNTPGLRDLQAVEPLRGLVAAVREELAALGLERPVLVKIAPDLADEDVDAIADLALELGLAGIIATNTTVARSGLRSRDVPAAGRHLRRAAEGARSLAVLRRLRARAGDGLVLVSVGGIEDADDAWERLQAGATLVQAYTGFVYGGPGWPRRVNRELARRMRADAPGRSRTCIPRLGGACSIH